MTVAYYLILDNKRRKQLSTSPIMHATAASAAAADPSQGSTPEQQALAQGGAAAPMAAAGDAPGATARAGGRAPTRCSAAGTSACRHATADAPAPPAPPAAPAAPAARRPPSPYLIPELDGAGGHDARDLPHAARVTVRVEDRRAVFAQVPAVLAPPRRRDRPVDGGAPGEGGAPAVQDPRGPLPLDIRKVDGDVLPFMDVCCARSPSSGSTRRASDNGGSERRRPAE